MSGNLHNRKQIRVFRHDIVLKLGAVSVTALSTSVLCLYDGSNTPRIVNRRAARR